MARLTFYRRRAGTFSPWSPLVSLVAIVAWYVWTTIRRPWVALMGCALLPLALVIGWHWLAR